MLSGLFRSSTNWREEQISLHGKVSFEGTFLKEGSRRKNWTERKFMLYEDMTLLYHDGAKVKGILDLSRCILSYPDALAMVLAIDTIFGSGKTGNERIIEIHNTYDISSMKATTGGGTTTKGTNIPRLFKVVFLEVKNLSSFIIALVKLQEKRKIDNGSDRSASPSSTNEIKSNAKQFAISNTWIAPPDIATTLMSTSSKSEKSLLTSSKKDLESDDHESTLKKVWHLNENASTDNVEKHNGDRLIERSRVDYAWVLKIESIECYGLENKKQSLLSLSILKDQRSRSSVVVNATTDSSLDDPRISILSSRDSIVSTMSQALPSEQHIESVANKSSSTFYIGDTTSYDNYRQTTLFDSEFKNMLVYEDDVHDNTNDMSLQISMFDRSMYGYGSRNQVGAFILPFKDIVPFTKQTYNAATHNWEAGECSHIRLDGLAATQGDKRDNVDISTTSTRTKLSLTKYVSLTRKSTTMSSSKTKGEGEGEKMAFEELSDSLEDNTHLQQVKDPSTESESATKSIIFAKIVIHAVRLHPVEYLPLYPFHIKQKNFAKIVHLTKESMDEGFMTLEDWGNQTNLDPFDTYFNCSSSEDDSDDSSDDSEDEDGYIDQLRQQHHMEMYKKEKSEERDRKKKQDRSRSMKHKREKAKSVKFLNSVFSSGNEQHKSISIKKRGSRHINKVMSKQTNAHLLKLRREEGNESALAMDTSNSNAMVMQEDSNNDDKGGGDTSIKRRNTNKKRVTLKIEPTTVILDGECVRKGDVDDVSHDKSVGSKAQVSFRDSKESLSEQASASAAIVSNSDDRTKSNTTSAAKVSSISLSSSYQYRIFYTIIVILIVLLCIYHPVFAFVSRFTLYSGVNTVVFIEDLLTENDWINVVYKLSMDYLHGYLMSINLLVCILYGYQNQQTCLNELSIHSVLALCYENIESLIFRNQASVDNEGTSLEVEVEVEAQDSLFNFSWLYSDGSITFDKDDKDIEDSLEVVDDMPDMLSLLMKVFAPLLVLFGVYVSIKISLLCIRTISNFVLYWSYIKPAEKSKEKEEEAHPDLLMRGNFLVLERQQCLVDDNYFRILCSLGYTNFDQHNQWSQLVKKHRSIKKDKRGSYVKSLKEKRSRLEDECPPISVLLDEVTSNENQIWRSRGFEITKQGGLRYQHRNRVSTLLSKQLNSKTIDEKISNKSKDGKASVIRGKSNDGSTNSKGHTTSGRRWFGHKSFYTTQYALPDEMLDIDYSNTMELNGADNMTNTKTKSSAMYQVNEEEGYTIVSLSRCTVEDIRVGCAYWIPSFYDIHLDTSEMNTSFSNFIIASHSYQTYCQRETERKDDEDKKAPPSSEVLKDREQEIRRAFISSTLGKKMQRIWFHWFVNKKVKRYMEREKRKMRALGRSNVIMQRERNDIDTTYYQKLWDEYRQSSGVADIMDIHALAEGLDATNDTNTNDTHDADMHRNDQGPSHANDIRSIRYYESVLLHKDIKVPEEDLIKLPMLKLKFPWSSHSNSGENRIESLEAASQEEIELLICFTPGDIADSTRQTHKLFRQRYKGNNHDEYEEGYDSINKNKDDGNYSWLFTVFRTFVLTIITSVEIVLSWSSNTYPIGEISKQELLRPQDQLNISIAAYQNYEKFLLALQQSIQVQQDTDHVVNDSIREQNSLAREVKLLLSRIEGYLDALKIKEKAESGKSAHVFHGLSLISIQKATATIWTLLLLFTFFRYDRPMVVWIFSICTCLMVHIIRWSDPRAVNREGHIILQGNTQALSVGNNKPDGAYETPVKGTDSNNGESRNTGERVINAFQSRMRSIFPSQKQTPQS